ncbi:TM2 domain-containing protein [Gallionella capsiferriformans]|uniref:TM2 domain-containing protein n=1 Tax=Gallionella capsiferriformans (strain ES-2) TaxID=395494 RepID=D9SK93_GALCS|nr:NINE protein [Gallionella capsiferriformans]ADL56505.1 hypothetical protein Galf_2506 [Gallionella capsiferriformans ES-2]
MALIDCTECGNKISDLASSCPSCGAPLKSNQLIDTAQNMQNVVELRKNRSLAIVLALFLGGFGAHKFYLNQPGWGIAYLFFCWTFIPAIFSIVEAMIWLTKTDDEFFRTVG